MAKSLTGSSLASSYTSVLHTDTVSSATGPVESVYDGAGNFQQTAVYEPTVSGERPYVVATSEDALNLLTAGNAGDYNKGASVNFGTFGSMVVDEAYAQQSLIGVKTPSAAADIYKNRYLMGYYGILNKIKNNQNNFGTHSRAYAVQAYQISMNSSGDYTGCVAGYTLEQNDQEEYQTQIAQYVSNSTIHVMRIGVNGYAYNGALRSGGLIFNIGGNEFYDSGTDNTTSLGTASKRWSVVYAGTGTINTSDEARKTEIADLSAQEIAVGKELKTIIKKFKFKDAVAKKGSSARVHFGVIAQDVQAVFEKHGLDAAKYGLFCADEILVDANGNTYDEATTVDKSGLTKQVVLGVRYDELMALIIAAI